MNFLNLFRGRLLCSSDEAATTIPLLHSLQSEGFPGWGSDCGSLRKVVEGARPCKAHPVSIFKDRQLNAAQCNCCLPGRGAHRLARWCGWQVLAGIVQCITALRYRAARNSLPEMADCIAMRNGGVGSL